MNGTEVAFSQTVGQGGSAGPHVHRFRGGWSVSDGGFATFASTREEALRQYELHGPKHRRCGIDGCEDEATQTLAGLALCEPHLQAVQAETEASEMPRRRVESVRGGRTSDAERP